MPASLNLTGRTFGRWTVLGPAGRSLNRARLWRVECACGRLAERTLADLRRSLSCGCFRGERLAERNQLGLTPAAVGVSRTPKPKEPRPCAWCGREYRPFRERSRFCSARCRARARWAKVAADPASKLAHARRVTADHKRSTYMDHPACAHCGRPFRGPPLRLHCSRACLNAVIRAGKYRNAFHRRRVEAEAAALCGELERRAADAGTD